LTKNIFILWTFAEAVLFKHIFHPTFVGFTSLGGNSAFLESGVVYTANKPEKVEEGGVVNVM
jgi:hypothetical protein